MVLGDLLVEGQFWGQGLQVSGASIYWSVRPNGTTGAIRRAPLEGGAITELARLDDVLVLRLTAQRLYACGCEGLHRLDPSNGDLQLLALPDRCCDGLSLAGTAAYWSDLTEGVVHRTDLGSTETTPFVQGQAGPGWVVANAGAIYWMNYSDDPAAGGPFRIDLGGGEPQQLAVPAVPADWPEDVGVRPAGLALDDRYVYFALGAVRWNTLDRAAIVRVPKEGGTPVVLAQDSHYHVWDLAVDETHVYWARMRDNNFVPGDGPDIGGAVLRVPKEGGEVELLASGQNGPQSVVVEGDYVYWINYASGNIRRVRKPSP